MTDEQLKAIRKQLEQCRRWLKIDHDPDGHIKAYARDIPLLLDEVERLKTENAHLRGALDATDKRIVDAGKRVDIFGGRDTPQDMADEIEELRDRLEITREREATAESRTKESVQLQMAELRAEGVELRAEIKRLRGLLRDVYFDADGNEYGPFVSPERRREILDAIGEEWKS